MSNKLKTQCLACNSEFVYGGHLSGKTVKCPKCKEAVALPKSFSNSSLPPSEQARTDTTQPTVQEPPATSSEQWYWMNWNSERMGPILIDEMRSLVYSGAIQQNYLVWKTGMSDWVIASQTELSSAFIAVGQTIQPQHDSSKKPLKAISASNIDQNDAINFSYAGFWLRTRAAIIDGFIIGVLWYGVFGVAAFYLFGKDLNTPLFNLLGWLFAWPYYAIQESSIKQATIGKRQVGLIVADHFGKRITFEKASARYFLKIISNFSLFIGYLFCVWSSKKQCLHDIISKCIIIKKNDSAAAS